MATYEVNPRVLVWAREEAGLSVKEAAEALRRHLGKEDFEERLAQIESGSPLPSLSLLRAMSRLYKVSVVTLFRPVPPPRSSRPTDFRTLQGYAPALSRETLLAIRSVQRWQETLAELVEEVPDLYKPFDLPVVSLADNPAEVAANERQRLKVEVAEQAEWPDALEAFNIWRWRVEDLGILTFVLPIPLTDCRGFILGGNRRAPAVVISNNDIEEARIFTLFHEYAHILLRRFGICNQKEDVDERQVEYFSNNFAANLLMPKDKVVELAELCSLTVNSTFPDVLDAIQQVKKRFKVSGEAAALRLENLGLAPSGTYDQYGRWASSLPKRKRRGGANGKLYHRRYLNKLGNRYVWSVLTALREGLINAVDADDMLDGTRARHFNALEAELANRRQQYERVS